MKASAASKRTLKRAPTLPDKVARLLRDEISRGELRPGDRLPTEHHLCEMFGVSRPVVREAVSRLKYDGLVQSFQGRGLFVSEVANGSSFRIDDFDFDDKRQFANILELLVSVEGGATRLAAIRRTRKQLKAIETELRMMADEIAEGRDGVDADVQFHRHIVEATGNPFFIAFSEFLECQVRHLIREARANTARFAGLADKVQKEHEAIFEAIAAGDPERAKETAESHLRNAAKRLRTYKRGTRAPRRQ